jgi:formate dehydrogenase gamma subunit
VSSYQDSYHGLASKLGSTIVANCASCHGVHNILPSSDPRSTINHANLANTCGQCHPGASENFILGKIHLDLPVAQDAGSVASRWVRRIYLSLIVVVIGGMIIHNGLILRKKVMAKRRAELRTIVRMNLNQRVQHWLLLSSFLVLAFTGFALKYSDSSLATLLGSSETVRRLGHRIAAVVLIAVAIYHTSYMLLATEGRQGVKDFLPKKKDLLDLVQTLRYYLGLGLTKPLIGRFGYAEKAEYWAVVWGTIIMTVTGLMIWFKLGAFSFLPRWMVDVALQIHFYEAILATLAIIVWHLYNVILDPDVYPLNWAVVDGKVSEKYFKEEHPLAYDEMIEANKQSQRVSESAEDFRYKPAAAPGADKHDLFH